jgi:hypothetical protein
MGRLFNSFVAQNERAADNHGPSAECAATTWLGAD